jgi:hypothetical protein
MYFHSGRRGSNQSKEHGNTGEARSQGREDSPKSDFADAFFIWNS